MIITKKKPLEEVLEMAQPYDRVFIIGCGTCSTSCQTGGENEVAEMADRLGEKVIGTAIVEEPCDRRINRRDLKQSKEILKEADAVLVLSCGSGVQTLADFTGKVVLPGLDTCFIGEIERIGKYYDRCRACGDCILDETGGICPITRCAKALLNGPCGGQVEGKCEVGEYENDCAWVIIWKRLKEQDRLDKFMTFRPPRDYSKKVMLTEVIFK